MLGRAAMLFIIIDRPHINSGHFGLLSYEHAISVAAPEQLHQFGTEPVTALTGDVV
jgi:hypothetical protein